MSRERSRLAELLLEMRLLSAQTLSDLLTEQRRTGRRFGSVLAASPEVDEGRITKAVAARLGLEVVNLDGVNVHERVLALVPAALARRHGVLPWAVKRLGSHDVLYLVMEDPLDAELVTDIQRLCKRQVRALMARPSELGRAIEACYTRTSRDALGRRRAGGRREGRATPPPVVQPTDFGDPNESETRIDVGVYNPPQPAPRSSSAAEWERMDPLQESPARRASAITAPGSAAPAAAAAVVPAPSAYPFALEIPVDWEEADNPFDGPSLGQVPIGLEHTGIMPAVDLGEDEFEPPLPGAAADRSLANVGDIPLSQGEAAARTQDPSQDVAQAPSREVTQTAAERSASAGVGPKTDPGGAPLVSASSAQKSDTDPRTPAPADVQDSRGSASPEERSPPGPKTDPRSAATIEVRSPPGLKTTPTAAPIEGHPASGLKTTRTPAPIEVRPPAHPKDPPPSAPQWSAEEPSVDLPSAPLSPVVGRNTPTVDLPERVRRPAPERAQAVVVRPALSAVDDTFLQSEVTQSATTPSRPPQPARAARVPAAQASQAAGAARQTQDIQARRPRPGLDAAEELVQELIRGEPLTGSHRGHLLLALGRLLLAKGVISKQELVEALRHPRS